MTFDFDEYLKPFWLSATMVDESVLMVPNAEGVPEAPLLFAPKRIVSVRDAGLHTDYIENADWILADGRLQLLPGSGAAFLTREELYGADGKTMLWHEGHWFHNKQLAVTYEHGPEAWKGPVPEIENERLARTLAKLRGGRPLHIILYGDSIAEGYNASGFAGQEAPAAPYMPSWGELTAQNLGRRYASEIRFTNAALAGKDSNWGIANVRGLVTEAYPDLVILAFGMNDGAANMEPAAFQANIRSMMRDVSGQNPHAEFILVSPTLPNPASGAAGMQAGYSEPLRQLAGTGAAFVDMTGVHQELLKHKPYRDMTGNHINHPNDFLMRWHAQQISGTLIPWE